MKRAFLSYALKDRGLKNRLVLAMSELENDGLIMIWQDLHGAAGEKVAEQIERQIDRADIFIALITPHFLRSKYCVNMELKRAGIRAKAGRCLIVPVLLRRAPNWTTTPVDDSGTLLREFNPLPKRRDPIEAARLPDSEYEQVAQEFRELLSSPTTTMPAFALAESNFLHEFCLVVFEALRWCLQVDEWMHFYSDVDVDADPDLHGCMDVKVGAYEMVLLGLNNSNEKEQTQARIEWIRPLNQFRYSKVSDGSAQVLYAFTLKSDGVGRPYFKVDSFKDAIVPAALTLDLKEMIVFIRNVFRKQKLIDRPRTRRNRKKK